MKENDVLSDSFSSINVLLVHILNETKIFTELAFFFDRILVDLDLNLLLKLL